jgi:hypothetical protein
MENKGRAEKTQNAAKPRRLTILLGLLILFLVMIYLLVFMIGKSKKPIDRQSFPTDTISALTSVKFSSPEIYLSPSESPSGVNSDTPTKTPVPPTLTPTFTSTFTPTHSLTPTSSDTPTPSISPTPNYGFDFFVPPPNYAYPKQRINVIIFTHDQNTTCTFTFLYSSGYLETSGEILVPFDTCGWTWQIKSDDQSTSGKLIIQVGEYQPYYKIIQIRTR